MMRAVLIDDEPSGLKSLQLLIEKYCPNVKIVASTKVPAEGVDLIDNYHPEIVFLDIYMPKLTGFQLLDKLDFKKFQLIFTTAHEEYALKALKRNAVDYLLKPITGNDLRLAVTKAEGRIKDNIILPDLSDILKELKGSSLTHINVTTKDGIEILNIGDIAYIESFSGGSNIILDKGDVIRTLKPLKDLETLICTRNNAFIRIQNSFIININHVKSYLKGESGSVIMFNNRRIAISRERKADFIRKKNNEKM